MLAAAVGIAALGAPATPDGGVYQQALDVKMPDGIETAHHNHHNKRGHHEHGGHRHEHGGHKNQGFGKESKAEMAKETTDEIGGVQSTGGKWPLTTKDKVFHIGANKAGTTSMWEFYSELPGEWSPCHDLCGPQDTEWYSFSHEHDKDSPVWQSRVFLDNGDAADYEWLYHTFPNSRFVMNVRGIRDWLQSRYDMIREIRIGGGCTPEGTHESCAYGYYSECFPDSMVKYVGAKCIKSKLDWTGNTDEDLRQWVYGLAQVQQRQLKFFGQSPEHMNRFVMADLTDDSKTTDAMQRLWWANRADLGSYQAKHLLTLDAELPVKPPLEELAGPHAIPHMLSDPHPATSKSHIEAVLKSWNCGAHVEDTVYMPCSLKMQHSDGGSKDSFSLLKTKPTASGFPSAHKWYIQAKRMNATGAGLKLTEGATLVDSDAVAPSPAASAA